MQFYNGFLKSFWNFHAEQVRAEETRDDDSPESGSAVLPIVERRNHLSSILYLVGFIYALICSALGKKTRMESQRDAWQ